MSRAVVESEIEKALRGGKRYDTIAKELRVSTKTIAKVAKRMDELSPAKAIEMFEQGKSAVDVVRETNEDITKVANWYKSWVEAAEYRIKYETSLKEKYEQIKAVEEEQRIAEEVKGAANTAEHSSETQDRENWRRRFENRKV